MISPRRSPAEHASASSDPRSMARLVLARAKWLQPHEASFLREARRLGRKGWGAMTPKQAAYLRALHRRVCRPAATSREVAE